ncbi:HAD superfamily hydrolase (TIGR01450 family)/HAD superfamily hydrolase (TIGR01549 family) [Microbacteriaceae bacterium MWH-Ta3]|nr:HAD superfamily hydrolase (TIGR01450 family)/HAD superfamily hydrolase (TIGR01549 family) [Microbacteriaceae bacterium MWH-Ta3]
MATPLDGTDVVFADLDGVIYKGADAVPFAVESLVDASARARVAYITNNASRTPESVAEHLRELGLPARADDVVNSPQAAVRLLKTLVPAGATILVIGGEGLTTEVTNNGFVVTDSAEDSPAAVIQGFAPHLGWVHLAEASFALHTGIPWVATNTDWTIPVARGIAPGNGTLVSAVHLAVGRLPVFAGKPEKAIFDYARERFHASDPLVIGDRLDTDILGANRAGMRSALVLTGIDQAKQAIAADETMRPTYILEDLRQLDEEYPEVRLDVDGDVTSATVGDAVVRMKAHVVRIAHPGTSRINLLRAACAVVYNSGLRIYGLDVEPAIYS